MTSSAPAGEFALGLRLLFQTPPSLAFFDCGGVRLMLSPAESSGERHSSVLYFKVPDIAQACAVLKQRGVAFEGDANLLALMSEVR